MEPIEWLEERIPGFLELPQEDRSAIFHFTLLWSLFEARALETNASANAILALVHECALAGRLQIAAFEEGLQYFRHRYFANGQVTNFFMGLNLRRNDSPDLVTKVLAGENNEPADSVSALLIIILRLRNNLFHGVKWAYGIRDQRQNFEISNSVLMKALDQFERGWPDVPPAAINDWTPIAIGPSSLRAPT